MDRHETDKMKDQIEKIENIAALVDLGVTVSNRLQEVGKIFWPTMKQDIMNAKLKEYETVKKSMKQSRILPVIIAQPDRPFSPF